MKPTLVVIDTQQAFVADRDPGYPWANPEADLRIGGLIAAFRAAGLPVVHVHHHGLDPADSFHADNPQSRPMAVAEPAVGEAVVIKHGFVRLHRHWAGGDAARGRAGAAGQARPGRRGRAGAAGQARLVLCGGAANYCVESTARLAGNLGFDTRVVGEALINFQKTLRDGRVMPPQDVLALTLANLDGEFARVVSSDEILAELTVG